MHRRGELKYLEADSKPQSTQKRGAVGQATIALAFSILILSLAHPVYAGSTTINEPANTTVSPQSFKVVNITVTDPQEDVMNISVYGSNNTNSNSLLVYFENRVHGSNLTYNWTSPTIMTQYPNDNNRVAYWPLDKNASDYTNQRDGTVTNAQLKTEDGKIAGAYEFDGYEDYIAAGSSPFTSSQSITVSAWVNADTNTNNHMRIVDISSSGSGIWIGTDQTDGNKFTVSLYDGSQTYIDSTTTIETGQWYHVVATYDGTTGRIYVNGVEENSGTNGYNGATNRHIIIACPGTTLGSVGFLNDCWDGKIDEVGIWNRTLTSDEVRDLYRLENQTYFWKTTVDDGTSEELTGTQQFLIGSSLSVTLESPSNGASQSSPVDFNFTATQGTNTIQRCELFHNSSGTFQSEETDTSISPGEETNITQSLSSGLYLWNVKCIDTQGYSAFASANRTVTVSGGGGSDTDNDGVDDSTDRLLGHASSVTKNGIQSLKVNISGSSTQGSFTGEQTVTFNTSGQTIINFSHDFTTTVLDLSRVTVIVGGSSIIVDMDDQLSTQKTLWIEDSGLVAVCAKDAPIASLAEISGSCTGANEYDFTSCIGSQTPVTNGPLTCIDEGDRIRVENLSHSGVRGTSGSRFTGMEVTKGQVGSFTESTEGNDTSQGGNLTILNFSSSASTIKWQGYYGETEVSLSIGIDSNTLFSFGQAPNDQIRTVLATTATSFNFASIQAANASDIDITWGFSGLDADSGNQTLDDGQGVIGAIADVPYANLNAYNSTGNAINFRSGVLKDDGTITLQAYEELAFATNVIPDQTNFANNTQVDFELIVPVNGTSQVYYFYVDIS